MCYLSPSGKWGPPRPYHPREAPNNNPAPLVNLYLGAECGAGWFLLRSPVDVMDLWCLQAEATLSFMAEKEKALKDLSLTLPFFLLEVCTYVCGCLASVFLRGGGLRNSDSFRCCRIALCFRVLPLFLLCAYRVRRGEERNLIGSPK